MATLPKVEQYRALEAFFRPPGPGETLPDSATLDPTAFSPGELRHIARRLHDGADPEAIRADLSPEAIAELGQPGDFARAQFAQRWNVLGVDTLLQPPEPPEFLVDGMIRIPSLTSVYGVPGDLKTMLCLDLAVAVASGAPWAEPLPDVGTGGAYYVKQGPVLVLDQDNGEARLRERFGALLRGRNVNNAPVYAISLPRPVFDASNPEEADLLAEQIAALGAVLCMVDNLGTVSGGRDENSSQMVDVMANLRWVSESTGCGVIVVHHARKGNGAGGREGDRLRGHSSIEASLDLALLVERTDDDLTVRSTKTRDNPVKPFTLRWTYALTDQGALHKARFWHVCTTAPHRPEYKVIGDELGDLLTGMDKSPNQAGLRAQIRGTYGVGDSTARQAIEYAETHNVIGYVRQGAHSNAPKIYRASDLIPEESRETIPW